MRTAEAAGDRDWLARSSAPGRRAFQAAALGRCVAQAATVGGWAAIAVLVADRTWAALVGLVLAGGARAGALAVSRRWARRGARQVADSLRAALLRAVLPGRGGDTRPEGSAAAHALVELTDHVANHQARTEPARRAAAPSCVLVLLVVAVVHWPVALILATATPILAVNLRLAGLATEDAEHRQLAEVRSLSQQLLDRFRGMRTLVTLGAVERELRVVEQACDRLNQATMVVLRRAFVVSGVLDAVITCAIAVCATYVGLLLLGYVHAAWLPSLGFTGGLLVLVLCPVYFAPLRDYATGYHERDEALAAAQVLRGLLSRDGQPAESRPNPLPAPPEIRLTGVTVDPAGPRGTILRDVTTTVPAGRLTVLVAPSGEGKTTLLRLVAGLTTPQQGDVTLVDPATGQASGPRPGVAGWVGQSTVLVPGTLADNIAIADPAAAPESIAGAAWEAGLDPVLGLDTTLGEGGWGVSAGQARRVALARALLRDAPLWLLDEPTAHLDRQTERELLDTMLAVAAGRTVLVATHSAELIRRADVVLRLDRGRVTTDSPVVRG
jgi:ATP-binding cassette subfamily C protein CydD